METPWDGPDDAVSLAALFLHAFPQPPSMEWASDPNAAVTGGAHSPIADPPTLAAFRPPINAGPSPPRSAVALRKQSTRYHRRNSRLSLDPFLVSMFRPMRSHADPPL
ncbi:hypothetical protein K456DRAFT_1004204 [Colletotrichum gloeosporioides 23]|nr:hypothetical protein K456DRAFT_1004204 [Colletotrichum gloeosporioides 23]